MYHSSIHLNEVYPFLGKDNCDPILTTYIHHQSAEIKRAQEKHPALLIVPGGGYAKVSDREAEPIALNFLQDGFNVFVLSYSVKPHTFPTAIRELAAAMEIIHANAEAWNTDVERVALMGFSAGGHLACHYSNCYDIPEVRALFPESKPVQAVVLCYPVITADPSYSHKPSLINLSGHDPITPEDIEKFSLHLHVTEKTPPTFLWHTRPDQAVPVMNTLLYAQALAVQGIPFAVHIYPFGGHGLATADGQTNVSLGAQTALAHDWIDQARKWLSFTL